MEKKNMICAVGELLIDFTQTDTNDSGLPVISASPGGAPANFLCAVKKAGIDAAFIGKTGNDDFGRKLRDILISKGIDTRGLVADDKVFTTLAFVTLSADGERSFSFARKPGADTCLTCDEVDLSIIDSCDIFHFGSLSFTDDPSKSTIIYLLQYAKKQGKLISYDPNYRAPLWKSEEEARKNMLTGMHFADIVKISEDEAEFLFSASPEDTAEILINRYGCSLVFVTLGEKGCYCRNTLSCSNVSPDIKVSPVDTTGAGDIFAGTAAAMILKSGKHPSELTFEELTYIAANSCRTASLSTEKHGGML